MRRRRPLAAGMAAGMAAGLVLTGASARAEVEPGPGSSTASSETRALALLERAAEAGRRLTYSGTQYVASWHSGSTSSALLELRHDPEQGSLVTGADAGPATSTAALDARMLERLAAAYSLQVTGPGRCTGRPASVIDARRADGQVAGRFWVDRTSGVLLRREVYDDAGRRVRSSAFVDLEVDAAAPEPPAALDAQPAQAFAAPARSDVQRLRSSGWHVPRDLPAGFRLLETRQDGDVLHLAYTDGLSTLSLFAQDGELGSEPADGFEVDSVAGRPVWVDRADPARVVWAGGDRVWTLVSDAPDDAVRAAVAALPRDPAPDTGVRARLGRGLSRLGGILNPFG